ncbi:hypothetical protein AA313_de0202377 [Arthrobotrys entomopaga]|nr:hypothetical protein AA313_de0202377 [Arthrobotrys entomopaga]
MTPVTSPPPTESPIRSDTVHQTMGFLELGRRSRAPSSLSNLNALRAAATFTISAGENAITSLEPTSTFRTSAFEKLPLEVLQKIFAFSHNPDLPFTNSFLLTVLSSSFLTRHFFETLILDHSLTNAEYTTHLVNFMNRRFFTREFLTTVENNLWAKHFGPSLFSEYPHAKAVETEDITKLPSFGRIHYLPHTLLPLLDQPIAIEHMETEHLSALQYRVIFSKLDLRTIPFPKERLLLPPYTIEKVTFIKMLAERKPYMWMGVDKAWYGRAMEIAVALRSATMVFILKKLFNIDFEENTARLALLPAGDPLRAYLEPELSRGSEMSQEEDYEMFSVIDVMEGDKDSWLPDMGGGWGRLECSILDMTDGVSWFRDTDRAEVTVADDWHSFKNSLRILAAIGVLKWCQWLNVGEREYRDRGILGELRAVGGIQPGPRRGPHIGLVYDVLLWERALQNKKGSLFKWLLVQGMPPEEVFQLL